MTRHNHAIIIILGGDQEFWLTGAWDSLVTYNWHIPQSYWLHAKLPRRGKISCTPFSSISGGYNPRCVPRIYSFCHIVPSMKNCLSCFPDKVAEVTVTLCTPRYACDTVWVGPLSNGVGPWPPSMKHSGPANLGTRSQLLFYHMSVTTDVPHQTYYPLQNFG